MSEYQYYEFCKINKPLIAEARKEMYSLSSRANVSTHGASYVYNYGDFPGDPKELLLKYFDVFFYISSWGSIQLMFKYSDEHVDEHGMKKFSAKHIISCEKQKKYTLLDINFNNEDGFGWLEGEGMLFELLPLYDEIKSGNYQFLRLVVDISNGISGKTTNNLEGTSNLALSQAQEAFFKYASVEQYLVCE